MKSGHPEREAIRWQEQVESVCAGQGLHLTPLRRRVLTILSESSAPLGAYAIIDQLSRLEGKPIAPPTVYRTLDFFLDHGFVYKIESRNAYAPCEHLGHAHHGVLLLCDKCGRSDEIEDMGLDVDEGAGVVELVDVETAHPRLVLVMQGCARCARDDDVADPRRDAALHALVQVPGGR